MSTQTLTATETFHEPAQSFMPVMRPHEALERYQAFKDFVEDVLRPGVDYGIIPGTTKPTLLKPGAEKLATFFGLSVHFDSVQVIEDWTGEQHGGEPLFYYWYRCELTRDGRHVADAEASCNSREKKYRWRDSQRKCPSCGQPAIIKGRAEYGGGWVCFAKKGGCGAKFRDDDSGITGQQTGRAANEDIADAVNTIQKMAQKRALVAATLIGTNASEYFTQDVEDYIDADFIPAVRTPEPASLPRVGAVHPGTSVAAPTGGIPASGASDVPGNPQRVDAKPETKRAATVVATGAAPVSEGPLTDAVVSGAPAMAGQPADPSLSVDTDAAKSASARQEKSKKFAEPRAAYAPTAGASNGVPKHTTKEVDKLAAFFESPSAPVKPSAVTTLEGGAPSLEDAMAEWKAVWAQANKAGVRGSQYFAGSADTVSIIVEKTALLKEAIKTKQDTAAGK